MSYFWQEVNFLIGVYLLGSIPVGLVLSKLFNTPNPRLQGSGSIGTTNMYRVGGAKLAAITFTLDFLKGFLAVLLAYIFLPNLYQLAGMVVIIGHIFPIWLVFKGGKGVATALGVLLAWDIQVTFACLVTWGILVFTTRYISVGSLGAALIAPIAAYILHDELYVMAMLVIAILVVISHRENIRRLIAGKEPKIGDNSKKPPPEVDANR